MRILPRIRLRGGAISNYFGVESSGSQGRHDGASGRVAGAVFFHRHAIAAFIVFDARHVGLDQRQAAAAGALQVFVGRAVGHGVRLKAAAFVAHSQPESLRADFALDMHVLRFVEPIAVPDGVGERLFECQLDAEQVAAVPAQLLQARRRISSMQRHSAHRDGSAGSFARSNSSDAPTCD